MMQTQHSGGLGGPPPPGMDPDFDALVEAEMARRRQEAARAPVGGVRAPPSKGDDPVFDALVQAEMERQRREANIYARSALQQPYQAETKETPAKPGGISPPKRLTDAELRRERQKEYAEALRKQMIEPRRSLRHTDDYRPPFFNSPQNETLPPQSAHDQHYDPLRPGQIGLGRGMATLPGRHRPAPRREAQEAYAAELRRQMEEKKSREDHRRKVEQSEAEQRLRRLATHEQRLSPDSLYTDANSPSLKAQSRTYNIHDAPPPLRQQQQHHHHHHHQPQDQDPQHIVARPQQQLSQSPRQDYQNSARSRFVRDVYGDTNVAEMLGADCRHRLTPATNSALFPPDAAKVTRNHDPEAEAKRKALALTQKQALEAQIEERKQMKAREKAERQAEEERELLEAKRIESEAKQKKEAQLAQRQADEQKRLEELYAQQEAAAARRKHHTSGRPLPEDSHEAPAAIIQNPPQSQTVLHQDQYGPPSPPIPKGNNGIPRNVYDDINTNGGGQADEFELRASRFEAAVAAEVNRLKGKHTSERRHHHHTVDSPASIKALARHYDQEEYDVNSLSDLARGLSSPSRSTQKKQIECSQHLPPRLETFQPVADDIDDEEARRLLLRLMPGDKERRRRLAAGLVRDLGRDSFVMSQLSPEPPASWTGSADEDDFAAQWQRHHPVINQPSAMSEDVNSFASPPRRRFVGDAEHDEPFDYNDDRGYRSPSLSPPPNNHHHTPERRPSSRESQGLASTTPRDIPQFQYTPPPKSSSRHSTPHRYAASNKIPLETTLPPNSARSATSARSAHSTRSTKSKPNSARAQWNKTETWIPPPVLPDEKPLTSSGRDDAEECESSRHHHHHQPQTWEVDEDEEERI